MSYVIDRIENDIVILEDGINNNIKVKKRLLPENIREGDVVDFYNDAYSINTEETKKRRVETLALLKKIGL